jgi:hypothetical protein
MFRRNSQANEKIKKGHKIGVIDLIIGSLKRKSIN